MAGNPCGADPVLILRGRFQPSSRSSIAAWRQDLYRNETLYLLRCMASATSKRPKKRNGVRIFDSTTLTTNSFDYDVAVYGLFLLLHDGTRMRVSAQQRTPNDSHVLVCAVERHKSLLLMFRMPRMKLQSRTRAGFRLACSFQLRRLRFSICMALAFGLIRGIGGCFLLHFPQPCPF